MQKAPTTIHGITYKRRPANEADVFVRVLSPEYGLFTMSVKGAKRPKSKLNSSVLNFSHGEYAVVINQNGISTLRSASKIQQFEQLFTDLKLNAYASYFLDLADHVAVDYEVVPGLYELILQALTLLNQQQDPEIVLALVKTRMLTYFGVAPELRQCVICGEQHPTFDYSIELGGIVGTEHFAPSALHVSPKAVALLRTLGLMPLAQLGTIKISPHLSQQVLQLLTRIYQATLDLNLKTEKFLQDFSKL